MKRKAFRRCLFAILAVTVVLIVMQIGSFSSSAASEGDLTFTLNSDGESYSVSGCNTSASGALTIPSTHNGKPVTSIGQNAFYGCTSLASITIPDSVTSIGQNAFYGCTSLASITIPDSVTSIGNTAFAGCTSLESIVIPDSVTSIGNNVFASCTSLVNVAIPDSVTSIGVGAFYNCTSLESIVIPNSVTSIGRSAFENCSSLTSITLPFVGANKNGTSNTHFGYIFGASSYSENSSYVPESLKTVVITGGTGIADYAFFICNSLVSVTIPDSVTSIGSDAFRGCSSLTSITIPFVGASKNGTSNTHFGYIFGAISYSENSSFVPESLKTVVITDVTAIHSRSFYGCISLESIVIPDSVKSIGYRAFYRCSSLISMDFPDSVTSVDAEAFWYCTSLTNVYVTDIAAWCRISFADLSANPLYHAKNFYLNGELVTDLVIPNSVMSVKYAVFYNLQSLESITLPCLNTHLGYIFGADSFFDNNSYVPKSLKTVVITGGTSIVNGAFDNCRNLTSITIPDSVTSIGLGAFMTCDSLTSITLPFVGTTKDGTSNTYFGYVFGASSYSAQNSYVPKSLKTVVITGGTRIDDYAFRYCSNLTNVTIPVSVKSIGWLAFNGCTSLATVYYQGQRSGWNNITIECVLNATIVFVPCEGEHAWDEGVEAQAPTCSEEGILTYTCELCDAKKNEAIEKKPHEYTSVVTDPTCVDGGYTTHTCECGDEYVDSYVDALGHEYTSVVTDPTCTEQGYTTHTCHCGDTFVDSYVDALGHTDGEWVVDEDSTCTEEGSKHQVCAVCGETIATGTVEKQPHEYTSVVTSPTCVDGGYTTHTCHCGDSYVDSYVDVLGHTDGEWIVDEDSTCTKEGTKHQICAVCGETIKTETIDKKPHEYTSIVTEPTCATEGYTTHTCHCGDEYIDSYVDALGHTDGEWIVDEDSTCTKEGTKHQICAICGDTIATETIEMKPHAYTSVVTEPTCTEQGYTTHTCHCGDEYIDSYVDALGHEYTSVITAPTCGDKGYTTHTCHCGDSYVDSYVEAHGNHAYGVVDTPPAAGGTVGTLTYTCKVCGYSYSEEYVWAPVLMTGSEFVTAWGLDFTVSLTATSAIPEGRVFTLSYDTMAACFVGASSELVSVEAIDGALVLTALADIAEGAAFAELTFTASDYLSEGSHEFLSVNENEGVTGEFAPVVIYEMGDVNLDGAINSRDVLMIKQYVVKMVELTSAQLIYANVYADETSGGAPLINSRDAVLLQQFVVKMDVQLGDRVSVTFVEEETETVYTVRAGEELVSVPEATEGFAWSTDSTVYIVPDFKAILEDMICYAVRREQ